MLLRLAYLRVTNAFAVLRWHRDLVRRRHAAQSKPKRPGRPRTLHDLRRLNVRLAQRTR
ncbi:hypothetical protein [Frankia sp. Cas3]|uniref:hypothetical protein n=1 Tax=Frankia sp. Cas3 TaxID=3073926 RepID=UPI002AD24BDA|nr:hypothetical protein [Frankia sp. Cas3]